MKAKNGKSDPRSTRNDKKKGEGKKERRKDSDLLITRMLDLIRAEGLFEDLINERVGILHRAFRDEVLEFV